MAKKVTFDNLPQLVEQILELLTSGRSEHGGSPDLVQHIVRLEKRFDNLERIVSPDRPVMDKHTVLRVLKLRPKALVELERTGVLISHSEGRRTVFYEDDVVRCFMNQPQWKNALESAEKPERTEPKMPETESGKPSASIAELTGLSGRIDIKAAAVITGRNPATLYQLVKLRSIPFLKDGRSLLFIAEELQEWVKTHPARTYRSRKR